MRILGGWFSTSRAETPQSSERESATAELAASSPPARPVMEPFDESLPPESERTVYQRVPAELLQRARQAALSDAPPASFDDAERTAVFSPPRELLTQLLHQAGTLPDAPSAEAPEISVEAAPLVTAAVHRSDPPLRAEAAPGALAQRASLDVASSDASPPRRRRSYGLMAVLVLLLLAAGAVYMHSGRSLLIPSSPTKNG